MNELRAEHRKELDELKRALQEEYEQRESCKVTQSAKKDLVDLKPEMLTALKHTLEHGTTEQRSKVAMWGYGKLLEEGKADGDPLRLLIEGMPAPHVQETRTTEDAQEITADAGDARDDTD